MPGTGPGRAPTATSCVASGAARARRRRARAWRATRPPRARRRGRSTRTGGPPCRSLTVATTAPSGAGHRQLRVDEAVRDRHDAHRLPLHGVLRGDEDQDVARVPAGRRDGGAGDDAARAEAEASEGRSARDRPGWAAAAAGSGSRCVLWQRERQESRRRDCPGPAWHPPPQRAPGFRRVRGGSYRRRRSCQYSMTGTFDGRDEHPAVVGRYVLFGEIASGGMATVHLGRLLGPAGFSRTVAIKRLHPQFAKDPEFVVDVPRRGAARGAHPPPERRADARRRRRPTASSSSSWSTCTASRSRGCCARASREDAPPAARIVATIMAASLHGLHAAHEATGRARRAARASCTATCRRRTSWSASTASRACSTSASPRRAGRLQTTREGQRQGQARVHGARAAPRRGGDAADRRLRGVGRAVGGAHGQAPVPGRQRGGHRDRGAPRARSPPPSERRARTCRPRSTAS